MQTVKMTGPFSMNEWANLVNWLYTTFERDDLQRLLFFHKEESEPCCDDSEDMSDEIWQQSFYDIIDYEKDKMKVAERLKYAAECSQLHDPNTGQNVADAVTHFIDRLKAYRESMGSDKHRVFIGRHAEVTLVTDLLTRKPECKGVSLCGLGGQGKSSVAMKVCEELSFHCFTIARTDLRNIPDVVGVIRAVLASVEEKFPNTTRQEILENILMKFLDRRDRATLLVLDDCDEVMKTEWSKFETFLNNILIRASLQRHVKVRILLTMREKLARKDRTKAEGNIRELFSGMLAEIELRELEQDDAEQLLLTCSNTEIDAHLVEEIIKECAYSPLAISVVAELIRQGKFSPLCLLVHIKLDKRNVTSALRVDNCIKKAIRDLKLEHQKALVCLSVFQSDFGFKKACKVMERADERTHRDYMDNLTRCHLVIPEDGAFSNGERNTDRYSLHPLVYRYLYEWEKPKELSDTYVKASQRFMSMYQSEICKFVNLLESKYWKGRHQVEINKVHILRYYETLRSKKPKLLKKKYLAPLDNADFLVMKRVSDLADILLPVVQLRRLFQAEAERSLKQNNYAAYVFWMVEEADVILMLNDQVELALPTLDELSEKYKVPDVFQEGTAFPAFVLGIFHKVKGLCRWQQRLFSDAIRHLELAVMFHEHAFKDDVYVERIKYYTGQVYLDKGDLIEAEKFFRKGHEMVLDMVELDRDEHDDLREELHFDTPYYYFQFAKIKLIKAKTTRDQEDKDELLENALKDLERGILLDERLQLHYLNSYYSKLKLRADVKVEKGLLMSALEEAKFVFERRRVILQTPHTHFTESLYQIGRIYLLLGIELEKKGEQGTKNFETAEVYFKRMAKSHLKNGGISLDNPVFQDIKRDHIKLTKLIGNADRVKETELLYEKIEAGHFAPEKASSLANMMKMLWTPFEMLKNMYGDGGKEFGGIDEQLKKLESLALEEFEKMKLGDSNNISGTCGASGNLFDEMEGMKDRLFCETANLGTKARKRQKTVFETSV